MPAKVFVINRYVDGRRMETVTAHLSFESAFRTFKMLCDPNGYETYLINEVALIEDEVAAV